MKCIECKYYIPINNGKVGRCSTPIPFWIDLENQLEFDRYHNAVFPDMGITCQCFIKKEK